MLQIESHNGIAQMHTILLLVVKCVCVPGIVDACVKQSTYTYVSALVHTWYATHMNHASRYTHVLLTCNKHIMHVIRISGYLPLYSQNSKLTLSDSDIAMVCYYRLQMPCMTKESVLNKSHIMHLGVRCRAIVHEIHLCTCNTLILINTLQDIME